MIGGKQPPTTRCQPYRSDARLPFRSTCEMFATRFEFGRFCVMERYHFNVSHGGDAWPKDDTGIVLPSIKAAQTAAAQMGADLTLEAEDQSDETLDWQIDVTNPDGLILFVYLATVIYSPSLTRT